MHVEECMYDQMAIHASNFDKFTKNFSHNIIIRTLYHVRCRLPDIARLWSGVVRVCGLVWVCGFGEVT